MRRAALEPNHSIRVRKPDEDARGVSSAGRAQKLLPARPFRRFPAIPRERVDVRVGDRVPGEVRDFTGAQSSLADRRTMILFRKGCRVVSAGRTFDSVKGPITIKNRYMLQTAASYEFVERGGLRMAMPTPVLNSGWGETICCRISAAGERWTALATAGSFSVSSRSTSGSFRCN